MVAAMRELQQGGIEPTIWKLEGVRKENAAQALVKQAREAGRKAEVIILGRGASKERVQEWLKIGARTSGMVGFAVGRTIFWQSLIELKNGSIGRETAINQISKNYSEFVDFWRNQKQTYLEK
jgi:5-dehydro-2-deoxygluconokinase